MAPAISKRKRSPYTPVKSIGLRLPATATTSSADGIPGFPNQDVTKVLEAYGIASGKSHYANAVPVNVEDRESNVDCVPGGTVTSGTTHVTQCKKPSGLLGRFVLWNMNSRHSKVTDWGLSKISIQKRHTILDVGCGGGRTVSKLAAIAKEGKIYGLDFSKASVAFAKRTNRHWIDTGRVEIQEGSVSHLPFADDAFDLVTAVETHFWWPDLPADMREVLRVLKPDSMFIIIAEIYKGAETRIAKLAEKYLPLSGMTLLTADEHRELLANAAYSDVQIITEPSKGWICCTGRKPSTPAGLRQPRSANHR